MLGNPLSPGPRGGYSAPWVLIARFGRSRMESREIFRVGLWSGWLWTDHYAMWSACARGVQLAAAVP